MRRLITSATACRIAKELVEGRRLAQLDGVVVQDPVGRESGGVRFESALAQDVLGVEHLGHGDAMTEALVQRGQN